jgi:hypothetical protein
MLFFDRSFTHPPYLSYGLHQNCGEIVGSTINVPAFVREELLGQLIRFPQEELLSQNECTSNSTCLSPHNSGR